MSLAQQSFERRFAAALRRRLHPYTLLRLKTLARDTGYSEDTIARWLQGKHRVFAGAVEDVASYFAARHGDHGLLHEVFAFPPQAGAGATAADSCLWMTEDAVLPCPHGHAAVVREALGLPPGEDQDQVRFAVAVRGWVAAVVQAQGRLLLRYSPRAVRPLVALRLRDWLASQARYVSAIHFVAPNKAEWSPPTAVTFTEALRILDWSLLARESHRQAAALPTGAAAESIAL